MSVWIWRLFHGNDGALDISGRWTDLLQTLLKVQSHFSTENWTNLLFIGVMTPAQLTDEKKHLKLEVPPASADFRQGQQSGLTNFLSRIESAPKCNVFFSFFPFLPSLAEVTIPNTCIFIHIIIIPFRSLQALPLAVTGSYRPAPTIYGFPFCRLRVALKCRRRRETTTLSSLHTQKMASFHKDIEAGLLGTSGRWL